jgi:predicted DNA repair protein MutK
MAGASLLALIDKIAVVLDDVALMTKVAAKKTAGVLGDDLALNAQQVSGVNADRELPVIWAVAKGSVKNKLILVPTALLISAFLPWLITPLLMIGGAYLCFEGVEKIAHSFFIEKTSDSKNIIKERNENDASLKTTDPLLFEQDKINGAVRTDFILSAEIIVIALGTVQHTSLFNQIIVVSLIAAIMTVGVYGLVAGIVKLDDAGIYLLQQQGKRAKFKHYVGRALLAFAPKLMRSLSVIGTVAMFLVGGSILLHGLPVLHHWFEPLTTAAGSLPLVGFLLGAIMPLFIDFIVGFITGSLVLFTLKLLTPLITIFKRDKK